MFFCCCWRQVCLSRLCRELGEALIRNDGRTALTGGEILHLDYPAMMRVFNAAVRRKMPVPWRSNLSYLRQYESIFQFELENPLRKANPYTLFSVGPCRHQRVHRSIAKADCQSAGYAQRFAQSLPESFCRSFLVCSRTSSFFYIEEIDTLWLALTEKFAGRFLIGGGKVGKFTGLDENLDGYAGLLGTRSKEPADRVGRCNVLELLPLRGAGNVAVSDDPALGLAEPR